MNNVGTFQLASLLVGLRQPNSAQLGDALNSAVVVRAAFVWQLDLNTATVESIPDGPDRQMIAALAEEYGFPRPNATKLSALLARMEQSPLSCFCREYGVDPASNRGRVLFVAHAVALKDTDLNDSPPLLEWLSGQGISTVGQLGARADSLQPAKGAGTAGRGFRQRVRSFLSSSPWTKDIAS